MDLKSPRPCRTEEEDMEAHEIRCEERESLEKGDGRERHRGPFGATTVSLPAPISKIGYFSDCFIACIRLLVPEFPFTCAEKVGSRGFFVYQHPLKLVNRMYGSVN